ncbi:hypothetical protein QL995_21230 [Pseudoalteromonas sp. APC 3358]|uniref:hypothetical protein n=1 Tax=Pseudoalteromonas sp. APC 3358 TaxID=3035176 RepID=UPI0025B36DF2|nr:hypothetical protein [Pseudoalteromonas sp. APC 3358]MDN3385151.1 hypothetical protein [Pseudoalteromonas sp. APC 3358]
MTDATGEIKMNNKNSSEKHSDLRLGLSGLATAPIGYLVLLFLPVYLEVVGINLSLTEQQIGWLASTDSVGLALATFIFSIFIKKVNFRQVLGERLANYTYVLKFQGNKLSISGSGWHSSSRQAQM